VFLKSRGDGERCYSVAVTPLTIDRGSIGVKVVFNDVTAFKDLQRSHERSRTELETAYAEQQSTNEELETTNEELQSAIEELETTNEELQSTNEELETMNEELQSTNEELAGVNSQMREQTEQIDYTNALLESVFRSMQLAVAVVDMRMLVRRWNRAAEDLWGLRREEVLGRQISDLEIGLPVSHIEDKVRDCIAGRATPPVEVPAVNRLGRQIRCRVSCVPLRLKEGGAIAGVILLMEEPDEHVTSK
jgi:two-component system CheB/CheR fusion protein